MNQGQFFLFIIALFPIFSALSLRFFRNYEGFYNFIYYTLPILFLINLFQASQYFVKELCSFDFYKATQGLSIAFYADKISILFLYILGFLWLIFALYSVKYFKISFDKNSFRIREYFVLIISLLNFLILSKNLFTILFFYIYLIISSHFFSVKHFNLNLNLRENRLTKFFTFILYLESFLVFLGAVLTFKINNNINFLDQVILPNNFDELQFGVNFLFFFFGLFLLMLLPFYLFFKDIKFSSLNLFIIFLLSYALPSIFIFIKIIYYIFGFKGFAVLAEKYSLLFFEIIILLNLIISSYKYLREKHLKSALFYLFISQFGILVLSILIHLSNKFNYSFLTLIAFIINFTLIFLSASNFELFLSKIHNKNLAGIFYKMPINAIIFLFGILSLIGISPSLSTYEKIKILPYLMKNQNPLTFFIFLLNFCFLLIFLYKEIKIFFDKNNLDNIDENGNIIKIYEDVAKGIDNDSNLILTIVAVVIFSVLGIIINKFFMVL